MSQTRNGKLVLLLILAFVLVGTWLQAEADNHITYDATLSAGTGLRHSNGSEVLHLEIARRNANQRGYYRSGIMSWSSARRKSDIFPIETTSCEIIKRYEGGYEVCTTNTNLVAIKRDSTSNTAIFAAYGRDYKQVGWAAGAALARHKTANLKSNLNLYVEGSIKLARVFGIDVKLSGFHLSDPFRSDRSENFFGFGGSYAF